MSRKVVYPVAMIGHEVLPECQQWQKTHAHSGKNRQAPLRYDGQVWQTLPPVASHDCMHV